MDEAIAATAAASTSCTVANNVSAPAANPPAAATLSFTVAVPKHLASLVDRAPFSFRDVRAGLEGPPAGDEGLGQPAHIELVNTQAVLSPHPVPASPGAAVVPSAFNDLHSWDAMPGRDDGNDSGGDSDGGVPVLVAEAREMHYLLPHCCLAENPSTVSAAAPASSAASTSNAASAPASSPAPAPVSTMANKPRERRPSVADAARAVGGKNLWQKRRLSLQAKHVALVKQRTQQLAATMMTGVSDAHNVRILARQGKMGIELPGSVLKMTEGYEFRVYWFEIVECARKLALTGMPVWFEMGSTAQLTFGLLISFFSFGAYMLLNPFDKDSDDRLSQLCQAQTFFALLSSIILASAAEGGSTSRNMGVLLVLLTALPVGFAVWVELYGDDPKRSKERSMMRLANRFLVKPLRSRLLKKRAELGRKQREQEAGQRMYARMYARAQSSQNLGRGIDEWSRMTKRTSERCSLDSNASRASSMLRCQGSAKVVPQVDGTQSGDVLVSQVGLP